MADTETTGVGDEKQPIDILRWPDVNVAKLADVQHRFSVDSPLTVDVKNASVALAPVEVKQLDIKPVTANVSLSTVDVNPVKAAVELSSVDIKPVTANVSLSTVELKPVNVGVSEPVKLGFTDTPVRVDVRDATGSVNIATTSPVSMSLLGGKDPVALRFVLTDPIVAESDYTFRLMINGQELLSVSVKGKTRILQSSEG